MNYESFIALVAKMRDYQRRFYSTRCSLDLRAAKAIERRVDAEIKRWKDERDIPDVLTLWNT